MKSKKTFNIGESAQGGVITIEIKNNLVTIIMKEWDISKGTNKNSDQSGAKEFNRCEADVSIRGAYDKLNEFLWDMTTAYYADELLKWVKSKVQFVEYEY